MLPLTSLTEYSVAILVIDSFMLTPHFEAKWFAALVVLLMHHKEKWKEVVWPHETTLVVPFSILKTLAIVSLASPGRLFLL